MRWVQTLFLCVIVPAMLHSPAFAGAWAARIAEANRGSQDALRRAVAAKEHAKAKELLRVRDQQLALILAEFETAGEADVSEEDATGIITAYELLWRWEKAQRLAERFVAKHPEAEELHIANFRCLLNLNRVEEAAQRLDELEERFPQHSPIQFVHSMLAPKYQIQKKWKLVLHHSDIAARRRIAVVKTHPEIAEWALVDFRRIAEAAIAMDAKEIGTEILNDLARLLDETLLEIAGEESSDAAFSQQCLARKLRSDIAYWIGGEDAGAPFQQWVQSILKGWRSGTVSERVARRRASAVLSYLERHGGILTPEMVDSLQEMKSHADDLLAQSPGDDFLVRLSGRCQRAIESEAFRPRRRPDAFGGIAR